MFSIINEWTMTSMRWCFTTLRLFFCYFLVEYIKFVCSYKITTHIILPCMYLQVSNISWWMVDIWWKRWVTNNIHAKVSLVGSLHNYHVLNVYLYVCEKEKQRDGLPVEVKFIFWSKTFVFRYHKDVRIIKSSFILLFIKKHKF